MVFSLGPSPIPLFITTLLSAHCSQDSDQYRVVSEVRGQLKVLESIDRLNHKRKQDREKEKILRAAKSRSKVEDPEAAAKIKEQAKQVRAMLFDVGIANCQLQEGNEVMK